MNERTLVSLGETLELAAEDYTHGDGPDGALIVWVKALPGYVPPQPSGASSMCEV
jgi:hypothetical protein